MKGAENTTDMLHCFRGPYGGSVQGGFGTLFALRPQDLIGHFHGRLEIRPEGIILYALGEDKHFAPGNSYTFIDFLTEIRATPFTSALE